MNVSDKKPSSEHGRQSQAPHRCLTPEKEARAQYVIEQALLARAHGGRAAMEARIAELLDEDWQGNSTR